MVQKKNKDLLRSFLQGQTASQSSVDLKPGKLAQQLRAEPIYRSSDVFFVSPSPLLHQIRINALLDGKKLVMPTPGLKEGFVLYLPYKLSFRDLSYAVTSKGIGKFGERVDEDDYGSLGIDMLLTDAVAVDQDGNRLGDGLGYFDLACAVLEETDALCQGKNILAVGASHQLIPEKIECEAWDVQMDAFLSEKGLTHFHQDTRKITLFWDQLSDKRIKKIAPLWKLNCRRKSD